MPTLEQRVNKLESQIRRLLDQEEKPKQAERWENIIGTFAESEGFDEAVRFGREYRESLRPKNPKNPA